MVIAIEITLGSGSGGPTDIDKARLEAMITRVLARLGRPGATPSTADNSRGGIPKLRDKCSSRLRKDQPALAAVIVVRRAELRLGDFGVNLVRPPDGSS